MSSFDVQKVLEVSKNVPGEIQDVNYRGLGEKDKCDFDFLKLNENHQKDRLVEYFNDRLSFLENNGAGENPAGNLTAMEDHNTCVV